jgi:1-acyl-sn-glycerol-3-phosphate acyltransferase
VRRFNDESILLDTFKDGAFRLAINSKKFYCPCTFADNKKGFSILFLKQELCVSKMHSHIELQEKKGLITRSFREEVREIII